MQLSLASAEPRRQPTNDSAARARAALYVAPAQAPADRVRCHTKNRGVDPSTCRLFSVIYTPFGDETRQIAVTSGIPDISFREEDLTECFRHLRFSKELLMTNTQYGMERIYFIDKGDPAAGITDPDGAGNRPLSPAEPDGAPRAGPGTTPA